MHALISRSLAHAAGDESTSKLKKRREKRREKKNQLPPPRSPDPHRHRRRRAILRRAYRCGLRSGRHPRGIRRRRRAAILTVSVFFFPFAAGRGLVEEARRVGCGVGGGGGGGCEAERRDGCAAGEGSGGLRLPHQAPPHRGQRLVTPPRA